MMMFSLHKIILLIWIVLLYPAMVYAETSTLPTAPQQDVTELQPSDLAPLGSSDVNRYRRIFDLQANGKWKKADRLIKQLDDSILLGHVLYQRYMHATAYSSRYKELAKWMLNYPDHPGARRIYALARKKNGGKARKLHKPTPALALNFPADKPLNRYTTADSAQKKAKPNTTPPKARHKKADRIDIQRLKKNIKRYLRRRNPERAEKRLWAFERRALLSQAEFNILLGDIAGGYFLDNQDAKALALGKIAAENSQNVASQPDWFAGLAAWRLGDCAQAALHFEKVAQSPTAGDWAAAAGAFWAARANLVCRQPEKVTQLLTIATSFPRTFYGLVAARQLGQKPELDWTAPAFSKGHFDLIKDLKSVKRAIALSQTDKIMLADMELSDTWRRTRGNRHEALLGLAARLGLAGTQLKIGKIEEQKRRTALDSTLYPIPDTEPEGGFTIDRALILAIMRQESEFNSWAKSHSGARGLMQVMPRTASYISRDRSLRYGSRIKLDEPRYNMALGQQYVQTMLGKGFADGNLFKTLTAYNAGPGNLKKWERKTNFQDDPLLFIESIPARETRNYIERVISNYWIYQMRMKQPVRSLDMVAMGGWPMYISQDNDNNKRQVHASR